MANRDITAKFEQGVMVLHIDLGEDSGAVIRCLPDGSFTLHEIPQYGGEEMFACKPMTVTDAIETALGWA